MAICYLKHFLLLINSASVHKNLWCWGCRCVFFLQRVLEVWDDLWPEAHDFSAEIVQIIDGFLDVVFAESVFDSTLDGVEKVGGGGFNISCDELFVRQKENRNYSKKNMLKYNSRKRVDYLIKLRQKLSFSNAPERRRKRRWKLVLTWPWLMTVNVQRKSGTIDLTWVEFKLGVISEIWTHHSIPITILIFSPNISQEILSNW